MTDRNKRILLGAVIVAILCTLAWMAYRCNQPSTPQDPRSPAVIATETRVEQAKTQYVAKKEQNIQLEENAAKNAVFECDQQEDAEILLDFAELIERATKYNEAKRKEGASHE